MAFVAYSAILASASTLAYKGVVGRYALRVDLPGEASYSLFVPLHPYHAYGAVGAGVSLISLVVLLRRRRGVKEGCDRVSRALRQPCWARSIRRHTWR